MFTQLLKFMSCIGLLVLGIKRGLQFITKEPEPKTHCPAMMIHRDESDVAHIVKAHTPNNEYATSFCGIAGSPEIIDPNLKLCKKCISVLKHQIKI